MHLTGALSLHCVLLQTCSVSREVFRSSLRTGRFVFSLPTHSKLVRRVSTGTFTHVPDLLPCIRSFTFISAVVSGRAGF